MKKNNVMILPTIICLIPLIAGIILYPKIPDVIATHWDGHGVPDGHSSKFVGIIVLPLVLSLVSIFTPKLIELDPKNKNLDNKVKNVVIWIIPIVCFVCGFTTLLQALGKQVRVEIIIPMIVGIMIAIIGNYLPKTKSNYSVGIKIPWTLNDEENWNKTHRVGGFIFLIGGLAMAISSFFECRVIVMLVVLFAMIIIPALYSYLLYRKNK